MALPDVLKNPNPISDDPLYDEKHKDVPLAEHLTAEQIEKIVEVWSEIEDKAKSCQKSWGMGFPCISLVLLKPEFRKLGLALLEIDD